MHTQQSIKMLLLATFFVASGWSAEAAEIELREGAVVVGTVVRLGDLAHVRHDDAAIAAEWESLALFPAPAVGKTRIVKQQELSQLLAFIDEPLAGCRVVGASAVQIRSTPATAANAPSVVQPAGYQARSVSKPMAATAAHVAAVAAHAASPIPVVANLPASPSEALAVVALRRLDRGSLIRREDVALRQFPAEQIASGAIADLNAVIGREATQMINASSPIAAKMVQKPRLVRRGEVVTIRSIAAGIRVTTSGKAREDGSEGDLVQVELDDTNERIVARIVGVQQVEVYVGGPRVATQKSVPPTTAQR